MIKRTFNITARIEQGQPPFCFQCVQGDKDAYALHIRITEGDKEINYNEVSSATITFALSNGAVVQSDPARLTVSSTGITYQMGTSEISCPGKVQASIQLFGSSGERLTTARFSFEVIPDLITPSAVQSTSEFPILQRLKEELEAIDVVDLTNQFNAHKAESVQQGGGVHGLIVEKGTWTPTLNSDQNVELDIQTGSYVRVGDIVHCFMDIQIGNMGSWSGTQIAFIRGLPFVAKNAAPNSVAEYSKINLPVNGKDMFFIAELNTIYLRSNRGSVDGSAVSYVASHFGVGSRIRTSFSYQI